MIRPIPLAGPDDRDRACAAVRVAEKGMVVHIRPPKRSTDQNAHFHAICHELAKGGAEWAGQKRTQEEWKFLLVSGHAIVTDRPGELMLGLENERVMLRPSTAAMSVAEMSSLIEYCIAWATSHGIQLRDGE